MRINNFFGWIVVFFNERLNFEFLLDLEWEMFLRKYCFGANSSKKTSMSITIEK